jgi:hypothetical protein
MASRNEIELIFKVLNLGKKEMAALEKQLGKIEKEGKKTSKGMALLGKAIAAIGFAAAAKQAATFVFEATKLAARVETLGVVTQTLGKTAGFTAAEITQLERAIQKKGITVQASRQALARMMQAELDLADATDLARLAQDAAVIAGTNSSEAFQRLINVISTGNVRMARTMGLQVNFNKGYEEMAEQLGKTADELTAQEKAQSRANSVLAEGEQIAGAYKAAMDTVGKQLESTARFVEEFTVAVGKSKVGVLGFVNTAAQKWLQSATEQLKIETLLLESVELGIIGNKELFETLDDLTNKRVDSKTILEELTVSMDEYTQRIIDQSPEMQKLIGFQQAHARAADVATEAVEQVAEETKSFLDEVDRKIASPISSFIDDLEWFLQTKGGPKKAFDTLKEAAEDLAAAGDDKGLGVVKQQALDLDMAILDVQGKMENLYPSQIAENIRTDLGVPFWEALEFVQGTDGIEAALTRLSEKTWQINVFYNVKGGKSWVTGSVGTVLPNLDVPSEAKDKATGRAAGGPLSSVSLVGEEGFEIIINGIVIPHDESKRLMRLGLVPEEGFAQGGRGREGRTWPRSRPPGSGSAWHSPNQYPIDFSYLSQQTGVPAGGAVSAGGNAQVVAATQASVSIAAVVAKGNALTASQNDTIIDILSTLATAEDVQLAMETALELAVL